MKTRVLMKKFQETKMSRISINNQTANKKINQIFYYEYDPLVLKQPDLVDSNQN